VFVAEPPTGHHVASEHESCRNERQGRASRHAHGHREPTTSKGSRPHQQVCHKGRIPSADDARNALWAANQLASAPTSGEGAATPATTTESARQSETGAGPPRHGQDAVRARRTKHGAALRRRPQAPVLRQDSIHRTTMAIADERSIGRPRAYARRTLSRSTAICAQPTPE